MYKLEILKGNLESEGIQCFVVDQNMSTVGFAGEYRLQVDSLNLEKAKNILNKVN